MQVSISDIRICFLMTALHALIYGKGATKMIMPFKHRVSPPVHFSLAHRTSIVHNIT
ncbi:MAG: hypothetical protein JW705_07535 [Methanosarcinaceae archaeon]|nr:hypothetical protein [Methanosarcinaceae archaeon]